jgi:hypothetical protein
MLASANRSLVSIALFAGAVAAATLIGAQALAKNVSRRRK